MARSERWDGEILVDDGCPDLGIPSCLACPLSACRYERPPGAARAEKKAGRLNDLLTAGRTMEQASLEMGVSRRTVYRLRRTYLRSAS